MMRNVLLAIALVVLPITAQAQAERYSSMMTSGFVQTIPPTPAKSYVANVIATLDTTTGAVQICNSGFPPAACVKVAGLVAAGGPVRRFQILPTRTTDDSNQAREPYVGMQDTTTGDIYSFSMKFKKDGLSIHSVERIKIGALQP